MIKAAVVEDTEEIRESLQTIINDSDGFSCSHVYSNAEDAIAQMPRNKIDVAVVDINLPGKSGIECVKTLLPLMPDTQFMMCTVYDDNDSIFNALAAGAAGYILKHTTPALIVEALRELHNGGSPMSDEIARRVVASFHIKEKNALQVSTLSNREMEILSSLAKGFLYKEIAANLDISINTVKIHIRNIYDKLHVQNRMEAVNKAFPKR